MTFIHILTISLLLTPFAAVRDDYKLTGIDSLAFVQFLDLGLVHAGNLQIVERIMPGAIGIVSADCLKNARQIIELEYVEYGNRLVLKQNRGNPRGNISQPQTDPREIFQYISKKDLLLSVIAVKHPVYVIIAQEGSDRAVNLAAFDQLPIVESNGDIAIRCDSRGGQDPVYQAARGAVGMAFSTSLDALRRSIDENCDFAELCVRYGVDRWLPSPQKTRLLRASITDFAPQYTNGDRHGRGMNDPTARFRLQALRKKSERRLTASFDYLDEADVSFRVNVDLYFDERSARIGLDGAERAAEMLRDSTLLERKQDGAAVITVRKKN